MGSVLTSIKLHPGGIVNSLASGSLKQKRKTEDDGEVRPTKKKRLESTIKFVYQSCFVEGKGSDITVNVLGRSWRLHKTYLQQSPYFASMFSGNWLEKDRPEITIEVTDPNIDDESINIVFGSCYCYELRICPKKVIGVLAAASLFQLEGVIDICIEIMIENISAMTLLEYYKAARDYGIQKVEDEVILWLSSNLATYMYLNIEYLSGIPPSLMEKAMKCPDLCVMETETFLYLLLRVWMYTRVNPEWHAESAINTACENYFRQFKRGEAISFLEKPEGQDYTSSFQYLRIASLLEHSHSAQTIFDDNIIPMSSLHEALWKHWFSFLRIFRGFDSGPSEVADEFFMANAVRVGRILDSESTQTWKWDVLNFGIELVWTVKRNVFYVERVKGGIVEPSNSSSPRKMIVRVIVFKLNENRQLQEKVISAKRVITLTKYREVRLFDFTQCATAFPLYLNVQLLLATPDASVMPS